MIATMPKPAVTVFIALLVATCLADSVGSRTATAAAPLSLSDGWHSWQVAVIDDAPSWCCFSDVGQHTAQTACQLDATNQHFMSSADDRVAAGSMRIYVRMHDGRATSIRALDASCPVSADSQIHDNGTMPANDSAGWLGQWITGSDHLSTEALAAVAVHDGHIARAELLAATHPEKDSELRKNTVFWMGQLRSQDMRKEILALMFDDHDPRMRAHTAFSWSQSSVDDRARALIKLGDADRDSFVRGHAWFSLALTADSQAEAAILQAVATDKSREVREQAIFALSQLPDERAIEALVTILENRNKSYVTSDRDRAMFWMAQSDSNRAHDYLARILQ